MKLTRARVYLASAAAVTVTLGVVGYLALIGFTQPGRTYDEGIAPTTIDIGPADAVAEVKRILPAMIVEDYEIGMLPPDILALPLAERDAWGSGLENRTRTEAAMRRVWSDSLVEEWLDVYASDTEDYVGTIEVTAEDFEVVEWQGVHVVGDTATAVVEGVELRTVSGEVREIESQWVVTLVREPSAPHGWLMTESETQYLDPADYT